MQMLQVEQNTIPSMQILFNMLVFPGLMFLLWSSQQANSHHEVFYNLQLFHPTSRCSSLPNKVNLTASMSLFCNWNNFEKGKQVQFEIWRPCPFPKWWKNNYAFPNGAHKFNPPHSMNMQNMYTLSYSIQSCPSLNVSSSCLSTPLVWTLGDVACSFSLPLFPHLQQLLALQKLLEGSQQMSLQ